VNQPWLVRVATPEDSDLLAAFACIGPSAGSSGGDVWEREVEEFIRTQLASWAFDPYAQDGDPRLLLVVTTEAGELVAVGAHERVTLHDAVSGERLAATKIEVVAVATAWQGRRFTADDGEAAGPRVSDVLMSAIMADVAARVPPRDARVLAVVHQDNSRSLALCHRYGLTEELTRPHPSYRRLITGVVAGSADG
jgi:hypothetical protein